MQTNEGAWPFKARTSYLNEARPSNRRNSSRRANIEWKVVQDGRNKKLLWKFLRDVDVNEEIVVDYGGDEEGGGGGGGGGAGKGKGNGIGESNDRSNGSGKRKGETACLRAASKRPRMSKE